jgi:hypothetical protein
MVKKLQRLRQGTTELSDVEHLLAAPHRDIPNILKSNKQFGDHQFPHCPSHTNAQRPSKKEAATTGTSETFSTDSRHQTSSLTR